MDWNGHMSGGEGFFSMLALLIIGPAIVWIARELGVSRDRGPAPPVSTQEALDGGWRAARPTPSSMRSGARRWHRGPNRCTPAGVTAGASRLRVDPGLITATA
jgi:hypothetical protein